jgi:hypothetical protein
MGMHKRELHPAGCHYLLTEHVTTSTSGRAGADCAWTRAFVMLVALGRARVVIRIEAYVAVKAWGECGHTSFLVEGAHTCRPHMGLTHEPLGILLIIQLFARCGSSSLFLGSCRRSSCCSVCTLVVGGSLWWWGCNLSRCFCGHARCWVTSLIPHSCVELASACCEGLVTLCDFTSSIRHWCVEPAAAWCEGRATLCGCTCLCGRTCSIFEGGRRHPCPAKHETSGYQRDLTEMGSDVLCHRCTVRIPKWPR